MILSAYPNLQLLSSMDHSKKTMQINGKRLSGEVESLFWGWK